MSGTVGSKCPSVICIGTHSSRTATHEGVAFSDLDELYLLVQRANTDSQHVLIAVEKKSTSYYGVEIPPIISEEFEMLKRNILCFFKVSWILFFFLIVMVIWRLYLCLHLKDNSHPVNLIWSFFRNLKCLVKIMNMLIIFCKVSFSENKSSRYLNVFLNILMKEILQRKFPQCIHAFIKTNVTNWRDGYNWDCLEVCSPFAVLALLYMIVVKHWVEGYRISNHRAILFQVFLEL